MAATIFSAMVGGSCCHMGLSIVMGGSPVASIGWFIKNGTSQSSWMIFRGTPMNQGRPRYWMILVHQTLGLTINNRWFQISMNRYNHLGISENGGYNKLAISEREINSINCWSTILFDIFGQAIHGPFIPHFVAMFWLTRAARNHGGCGSTSQISVGEWFSHSKSQPFTQKSSAQKYVVNSLIHIPHVVALIDLQLDSGLFLGLPH